MNCALRFRTFAPTNSTETLASFCHPALISAPRVLCAPETRIRVQNARRVSRTEVSPWCVADTGQDRGQVVYASLACDNFSLSRESESSLSQHSLLRLKFTQTQLGPAYDTLMSKLTTLLWRWNRRVIKG